MANSICGLFYGLGFTGSQCDLPLYKLDEVTPIDHFFEVVERMMENIPVWWQVVKQEVEEKGFKYRLFQDWAALSLEIIALKRMNNCLE